MRISELVAHARDKFASDIHGVKGEAIVFRYASKVEPARAVIVTDEHISELIELLTKRDETIFRKRGGITATVKGTFGQVRLTLTRERSGTRFHMRILGVKPKSLTDLNLPDQIKKLLNQHGIILFVAPKGHGKTTATSACIETILDGERGRTIVKIERPIEHSHEPRANGSFVSPREVGDDTPTYADAVRDASQSDTDVIVMGEINSRDSAVAVLEALDNGALVIANMQVRDSVTALMRFAGWFSGNEQEEVRKRFAENLLGIFAIRLIPAKPPVAPGKPQHYPAVEIVIPDARIKNGLIEGKYQAVRDAITSPPNRNLQQAAKELIDQGKVDQRAVSLALMADE